MYLTTKPRRAQRGLFLSWWPWSLSGEEPFAPQKKEGGLTTKAQRAQRGFGSYFVLLES